MRAAIQQCAYFTIAGPRDDDRPAADVDALEVVGLRDFGFVQQENPGPAEYP
jgi:hypothetical protein